MTTTDEKIEAKFQALMRDGWNILRACGWDGREYQQHPSDVDYMRWRTEAMNLIERVCGKNSAHYTAIHRMAEDKTTALNSYYLKDCLGILEASHRDYQGGFLSDIRRLVRADLLDDILGQAEALIEQGYHIPAASLAGAVLEDTLRKLCDKHSIPYPVKTKIDSLNTELARAEAYDKLVQKEITAKADLRNNADHGHFDKVRSSDVEDMVRWVRRFVQEWLS